MTKENRTTQEANPQNFKAEVVTSNTVVKTVRSTTTRELVYASGQKFTPGTSIVKRLQIQGQTTIFELMKQQEDKDNLPGISAKTTKIFYMLAHSFTLKNSANNEKIDTGAKINLMDFIIGLRPELKEMGQEKAKTIIYNERKSIDNELETLSSIRFSTVYGEEKHKRDYENINIFQKTGIKDGYITAQFTEDIARYLLKEQINYYDTRLLSIPNNQPNAYKLGYMVVDRWNFIDRKTKGKIPTHDRLKVESILKKLDLPTIEQLKKSRNSWKKRLKKQLETYLDLLLTQEIITEWYYGTTGGKRIVNSKDISSYEEWKELLVFYKRSTDN